MELVNLQRDGSVATLTLNRPDVLNSFNTDMANQLKLRLEQVGSDNQVRSILLTGAGRAFCAGQDLSDVAPSSDGTLPDLGNIVRECYNPIIRLLRLIEKPILCAVNGVAAGAGANLAFACDIVFASEKASFIQSFSKVGLIPDSGGTFYLPRLIGLSRATALMFLGEKIGAQEACNLGLVYKMFPAEKLMSEALSVAHELAAQPTRGFGLTKRALNHSYDHDFREQLEFEEVLQREAGLTADYAEGVTAFLEKRKPKFSGR